MICRIRLKEYRNFENAEFDFSPQITLVTGKNGTGKTNLLEGIYAILHQGRSFYPGKQILIRTGSEQAHVSAFFKNEGDFSDELALLLKKGEKVFFRDQKKVRNGVFSDRYPAVVFYPEEREIFKGEPALRRSFFDRVISETDHEYWNNLLEYRRICRMRRMLLLSGQDDEHYCPEWIRRGSLIFYRRLFFVNELNRILRSQESEAVISYISTAGIPSSLDPQVISGFFSETSSRNRKEEQRKKKILAGPHLDDYKITFSGDDLRFFASSGQTRHAVFLLKRALADLIHEKTGRFPIFLIDEFGESLDFERIEMLKKKFPGVQVILTSCRPSAADLFSGAEIIRL